MELATKNDFEKPTIELIPPCSIFAAARAFKYGADKYDANNWRKGLRHSRLFGALQRHLWSYWGGEDMDEESGLHHLDHAMACMCMLVENAYTREDLDDRFKPD